MEMGASINLEAICKSYDLHGNAVLKDLSIKIEQEESVVITGPSGSGKSTLLNIIGTLDSADSGKVELDGKDLSQLSERERAALRLREIGFVFQLHYLLPQCTVMENVLVPTLPKNAEIPSADAGKRAEALLAKLGLNERMHHRPGQLSGGERQRVAVARALINRPRLLLADEPTGSLDRKAADELAHLLIDINREEKVTLVTVTHSPDLARQMGRQLKLIDGKLV